MARLARSKEIEGEDGAGRLRLVANRHQELAAFSPKVLNDTRHVDADVKF